jgi:hypothetical protein
LPTKLQHIPSETVMRHSGLRDGRFAMALPIYQLHK